MSWMSRLCETYETVSFAAGIQIDGKEPLLPIMHAKLKAHITVTLDAEGNFLRARAQEDTEGTIAPVTEASAGRSGKLPPPHPLSDKLQYLAGDYYDYVDDKRNDKFHYEYISRLQSWRDSQYGHPALSAICSYLEKGTLIGDLLGERVLYTGDDGKVLEKWDTSKGEKPPLYRISNLVPHKANVRFEVGGIGEETRTWMIPELRSLFISYMGQAEEKSALCYVSGKELPYTENHPKNIVNTAANAKLISSNDTTYFTFRGRVDKAHEAVTVSSEATLKAHAALRWLVSTQGIRCGSQVILAFAIHGGVALPNPTAGTQSFFDDEQETEADIVQKAEKLSGSAYAERLKKALYGGKYRELEKHKPVVVMALDNASDGKMAITFYREMLAGEYLESVLAWHKTCAWRISSGKSWYLGAPSFFDICDAAYGFGRQVDDKQRKSLRERMLPCVFDDSPLPDDVVEAAVSRAFRPMSFDEMWQWRKCLSVACALYRKKIEKEEKNLDYEAMHDRSFLYGRLLAVADRAETVMLKKLKEDRPTNAMRYMEAMSQKPLRTWDVVRSRLQPYMLRMKPGTRNYFQGQIDEICKLFSPDENKKTERLNGMFHMGFSWQRNEMSNPKKENVEQIEMEELENESEE